MKKAGSCSGGAPFPKFSWPGLAPAGEALFFASPKKSTQKKGDPQSGSLRYATGNLRCSTAEGVWLNSLRCATLKQRDPLSACLCAPRPSQDGAIGSGNRIPNTRKPMPTRTRRGESLFLLVFGVLSSAVWLFWYSGSPCGCAEERRARRIRAKTCLSEASCF